MNSPFLSSNNCSQSGFVFQYGSPMFFTVEQPTHRHRNNKRRYSTTFATQQQNEDLVDVSNSKRVREEVAEEEPAVYSPTKRTRTTLLSKGHVFNPSLFVFNKRNESKRSQEQQIESITTQLNNLSLAPSHKEEMESITNQMKNLSLTESHEKEMKSITCRLSKLSLTESQEEVQKQNKYQEEIKSITCRMSKLSLTQNQEEVQKQNKCEMDWTYDSSMDWSYDFKYQK